jgi:AraC-like DNA-binding protein
MMEPYPKAYLYRRIVQAKLFMDANYMEPIDGDLISGEAAFSKFHFIRLFKQVYGAPPRVYLSNRRLDRAQQLLDEGAAVTDACYAVGFQSLTTFSRSFKRRMGSSPSAYRQERAERARHMSAQPMEHIPTCYAQWLGWAEVSNPG